MAEPSLIWRVSRRPRLSVLEMGEYMAADDGPRETILRDMKYERLGRTLSYRQAYEAVAVFLGSPLRSLSTLLAAQEALKREAELETNEHRRENIRRNIAALATFQASLNSLPIGGMQLTAAPPAPQSFTLSDVMLSVQPTVYVRVARQRGAELVGAIVVDLAKGQSLKSDDARARMTSAMEYSAVLVHQHVAATMCGDGAKASHEHSMIFHCHRGELICAPESYKKRLKNIEAACKVIARAWPYIEPPATYDERYAQFRN